MPNNTQPDYIALAMVAAMIIIVVIMVIRKWRSDHKAVSSETQVQEIAAPVAAPAPAVPVAPTPAPASAPVVTGGIIILATLLVNYLFSSKK